MCLQADDFDGLTVTVTANLYRFLSIHHWFSNIVIIIIYSWVLFINSLECVFISYCYYILGELLHFLCLLVWSESTCERQQNLERVSSRDTYANQLNACVQHVQANNWTSVKRKRWICVTCCTINTSVHTHPPGPTHPHTYIRNKHSHYTHIYIHTRAHIHAHAHTHAHNARARTHEATHISEKNSKLYWL